MEEEVLSRHLLFLYFGRKMGKHHDKIAEALEIRQRNTPNKSGYNMPGSMNKRKTGYRGVKRNKSR